LPVRPYMPSRDNRVARSVLPSIPRCAAVVRMVEVKRPGQANLICEFMAKIEPSNSHCAADFPPFAILCVLDQNSQQVRIARAQVGQVPS
jgi:hypothetical protein